MKTYQALITHGTYNETRTTVIIEKSSYYVDVNTKAVYDKTDGHALSRKNKGWELDVQSITA